MHCRKLTQLQLTHYVLETLQKIVNTSFFFNNLIIAMEKKFNEVKL